MKKTDLPVLPPSATAAATELLQANENLDDIDDTNDSNYSKELTDTEDMAANEEDEDNDEDDTNMDNDGNEGGEGDIDGDEDEDDLLADDEDDEMTADITAASGPDELTNNEYDSTEENYEDGSSSSTSSISSSSSARTANGGSGNGGNSPSSSSTSSLDNWSESNDAAIGNNLKTIITKKSKKSEAIAMLVSNAGNGIKIGNGMEMSLPPTTGQPTPDPYFTHFDPHYEHQSYKVSRQVSVLIYCNDLIRLSVKYIHLFQKLGSSTTPGGIASRESHTRNEGLVRFGGEISGYAFG